MAHDPATWAVELVDDLGVAAMPPQFLGPDGVWRDLCPPVMFDSEQRAREVLDLAPEGTRGRLVRL